MPTATSPGRYRPRDRRHHHQDEHDEVVPPSPQTGPHHAAGPLYPAGPAHGPRGPGARRRSRPGRAVPAALLPGDRLPPRQPPVRGLLHQARGPAHLRLPRVPGVPLPRHPRAVLPAPDHADPAGRQRGDPEHPGRRPDAVHPHQRLRLPRHQPRRDRRGAPDPASPNYANQVIAFVGANAPDTWNGLPVNFNQTFNNTVRYEEAFPDRAAASHPDAGDQPGAVGRPHQPAGLRPHQLRVRLPALPARDHALRLGHQPDPGPPPGGLPEGHPHRAEPAPGPRAGRPLQPLLPSVFHHRPPGPQPARAAPRDRPQRGLRAGHGGRHPGDPGSPPGARPSTPTASATAWACTSTTRTRGASPG